MQIYTYSFGETVRQKGIWSEWAGDLVELQGTIPICFGFSSIIQEILLSNEVYTNIIEEYKY